MSIKSTYPTMINNVVIFSADSWSVDSKVIETEFTTEAGTDTAIVQRYGKTTISAKYTASAKWLKTFAEFSKLASLTVKYYDPELEGYAEKNMRLRNFKHTLIPGSDSINESMGLYTVSFDLIEF